MPEIERQARARMRLVEPETAGKIVSNDIFWTVPFLDLYLARCDEVAFETPKAGYLLAYHAPALTGLIGVGDRPGEYASEKHCRSYRVHALAVYGSSCRRLDKITEAHTQYRQAFELLRQGEVAPRAKAELLSRYGSFLRGTPRNSEAAKLLTEALKLFREAEDFGGVAQTLVLRAGLHWLERDRRQAMLDLASALDAGTKAKGDPRAERAITAAFGNMARLVVEQDTKMPESSAALPLIRQARKRLARKSISMTKMQICWVEALLWRNLHCLPQALRLLRKAREGFRTLGAPHDFLIISMDLALTWLEDGDFEALAELQVDTLETLPELSQDPAFFELMDSWRGGSSSDSLLAIKQAAASIAR